MTSSESSEQRASVSNVKNNRKDKDGKNASTSQSGHNNFRRRSYADWISRAIQSVPEAKITLAGIYVWMSSNVPGLYEKRNLHSSKGWKNAVRHTLSVNRRFQKTSQPNTRAALWSIASTTDSESSSSPEQPEPEPEEKTLSVPISKLSLPSCSTLFTDGIAVTVTTCVAASCLSLQPSPTSTSCLFPSRTMIGSEPDSPLSESIITQRLELHQQDGTVRTVTVPKPFPIHVVGDYRLVTIDAKPFSPHVVTSG